MRRLRVRYLKLEQWTSLAALLISMAALIFSWQANRIASEANVLTTESLKISRESNRIALLDKADPLPQRGSAVIGVSVHGCRYPASDTFHIISLADIYITFSNSGGHIAVLERIEVRGTPYTWTSSILNEQGQGVELPVTILPDRTERFHFLALSNSRSRTESEAREVFQERYFSSPSLEWVFHFEDGRVVVWNTEGYGSAPELSFSRSCHDFDDLIFSS